MEPDTLKEPFLPPPSFLDGEGEMAMLIQKHDWSATTLGPPAQWPQSLKIILGILLKSKFPMFLMWGSENIQFYNDAYRPIFGNDGKHPAALGQKAQDCWVELWPSLSQRIKGVMEGGPGSWQEDQAYTIFRNGRLETMFATSSTSPVPGDSGAIEGMLVQCIDTTNNVIGSQKLHESEEQFRIFSNNLQSLAWIADGDGWIYWYNQRWYDYTGTTLEDMQGWGWDKVHHPNHIDRVVEYVKSAWLKDEPFEMLFPLRRADGEFHWFLTQVVPVFDRAGKRYRWVGTNTDVNEQVLGREALLESEERYKSLARRLEKEVAERTAELIRSNEDLQQFAHVASHDLKEPLRKIKTFANFIEADKELLSERSRIGLDKVQSAADRMATMINGVLTYSTVAATEQPDEPIDLNSVIANVEADLEVVIQQKGAVLEWDALPILFGAPVLIHQLFYNLINNALKFAKADVSPRITIKAKSRNGGFIEIEVADNGIGFPPEYAERIFKTFTRLHSKDKYDGTGLGLSLCKKIVERHHGTIEADGKEGQGATFTFTLPEGNVAAL